LSVGAIGEPNKKLCFAYRKTQSWSIAESCLKVVFDRVVKSRKVLDDCAQLWGRVKSLCLPDLQCAFAVMYADHALSGLSDDVIDHLEKGIVDPTIRLFYEGHIDLGWKFHRREICQRIEKIAEGCCDAIAMIVEEEDGL